MNAKTIFTATLIMLFGAGMNAQNESVALANVNLANAVMSSENKAEAAVLTNIQMRNIQAENEMLVVLDTRNHEAFDLGTISRAKFMGEQFTIEKIWMLDRALPVVIFGNDNDKNKEICGLLFEKGFTKVYYLYGTLTELAEQGVAISGDAAKSDKKAKSKK